MHLLVVIVVRQYSVQSVWSGQSTSLKKQQQQKIWISKLSFKGCFYLSIFYEKTLKFLVSSVGLEYYPANTFKLLGPPDYLVSCHRPGTVAVSSQRLLLQHVCFAGVFEWLSGEGTSGAAFADMQCLCWVLLLSLFSVNHWK